MDTMNKHTGFTLVELMIGLAIAAIVLTLGVPSFRDLYAKQSRHYDNQ